jgi:SAM-dependent methyltransferase
VNCPAQELPDSRYRRQRCCPVCLGDEISFCHDNRMAPIEGLDLSYRVAQCASCGFVHASHLPETTTFLNYYRELSKYDVLNSTAELSPADRTRASAAVALCRRHLEAGATIADIGCGTGALLAAFAGAGWSNLLGIDPAPHAAKKAKLLFGLDGVVTGVLQDAPRLLPLGKVDLICLTGVLEHLPDLRADVDLLLKSVGERTLVLIEVPAFEAATSKPFEPYGEFSLEHIQFFTRRSLTRLMESFGFCCLACEIVRLPKGTSDSVLALFARQSAADRTPPMDEPDLLQDYVRHSEPGFRQVVEHIADTGMERFIVYGAGSHSARLLPALAAIGQLPRVATIVDGNPNLQGKHLGEFEIHPPETLAKWPNVPVVVSSFAAQDAIVGMLHRRFGNPAILLYQQ